MTFEYFHEPATDPNEQRVLLLLHGTGGSQHDLVDIGKSLLPGAEIMSPLGNVREMGMTRWFKRYQEGVFDEDDIRRQVDDLAAFLKKTNRTFIALGYSNGANMGAALMTLHPELLDGLVMWRGMQIFKEPVAADLSGKRILMTNGAVDPMAPRPSVASQAQIFRDQGAIVTAQEFGTGHGLTQADFECTLQWLKQES